MEHGPEFLLLGEVMWEDGYPREQTVLALCKVAVLDEIFGQVDAVDTPVLHLELLEGQLALHSLGAELHGLLIHAHLGVDLSEIEEGESVISLQFHLVKAPIYEESEVLGGGQDGLSLRVTLDLAE